MLFTVVFSIMLISSIYIVIYTNYLTAANKKEMDRKAIQHKFRKPLQEVKVDEVQADRQVLVEGVLIMPELIETKPNNCISYLLEARALTIFLFP